MVFRMLADLVVAVHLAFVAFIPVGGFFPWRWPRMVWLHLAAVTWGVLMVSGAFDCPLTPLEKGLRRRGGEEVYSGGFIDHYVEGRLYPERYTPYLWAVGILLIVASYVGLARGRGRRGP